MIGRNIRTLRKHLKMTQVQFAASIGIRGPSLSAIESGQNTATNRLLTSICAVHGVNREWLETGQGEMFKPGNGGLERFSPAQMLLVEQFARYFAEKVPIAETDETMAVVEGLINILMSENESAKQAVKSSILAFNQTLESGDSQSPAPKRNPQSSTKRTKTV